MLLIWVVCMYYLDVHLVCLFLPISWSVALPGLPWPGSLGMSVRKYRCGLSVVFDNLMVHVFTSHICANVCRTHICMYQIL
jgi:hypothetical protein